MKKKNTSPPNAWRNIPFLFLLSHSELGPIHCSISRPSILNYVHCDITMVLFSLTSCHKKSNIVLLISISNCKATMFWMSSNMTWLIQCLFYRLGMCTDVLDLRFAEFVATWANLKWIVFWIDESARRCVKRRSKLPVTIFLFCRY